MDTTTEPQWRVIHIPEDTAIDGAVVELILYPDGIVGITPRIPAPSQNHG
jgi:hypothetical protein